MKCTGPRQRMDVRRGALLVLLASAAWWPPTTAAQSQKETYRLQSVKGTVEIQKGGKGEWQSVGPPAVMADVGDRVRTGPNGSVHVVTTTGQRVALGPNTQVILKEPSKPSGWRVLEGKVLAVFGGRTVKESAVEVIGRAREAHGRSAALWSVAVEGRADTSYTCYLANMTDSPIALEAVEYAVVDKEYAVTVSAEQPRGTGVEGGRADRHPRLAATLADVADQGLIRIGVREISEMADRLAREVEAAEAEGRLSSAASHGLTSELWKVDDCLWRGSEAFYSGDQKGADTSFAEAADVAQDLLDGLAASETRSASGIGDDEGDAAGDRSFIEADSIKAAIGGLPRPPPRAPRELAAGASSALPLRGVDPGEVLVVRARLRQGARVVRPATQIQITEDMARPSVRVLDTGERQGRSLTFHAEDEPGPEDCSGVARWFVSARRAGGSEEEATVTDAPAKPVRDSVSHTVTFPEPGRYEVAVCVADRAGNLSDVYIVNVDVRDRTVVVGTEGKMFEIRAPGAVAAAEG